MDWLSAIFGLAHYVVNFIVALNLAVDLIFGTAFRKEHFVSIKFLEQRVLFWHDTVTILGIVNRRAVVSSSGLGFKAKNTTN